MRIIAIIGITITGILLFLTIVSVFYKIPLPPMNIGTIIALRTYAVGFWIFLYFSKP